MITAFKILTITLLLSIHSFASFFGNVKASYFEDRGDFAYENKKYQDAFENYTSAAENGSAYGYFKLFAMYYKGEGVAQNKNLENQMLQKAADLKYPVAQVILANRLLFEQPKDYNKALNLLLEAAQTEYRRAYESLYIMYKHGIGVKKDINEAYKYYRLAKAQGLNLKEPTKVQKSIPIQKILVSNIQTGLKKLGFYKGVVDGISGPMTRKSIADFQKFYGYPVDSSVSESTLKQINNELK